MLSLREKHEYEAEIAQLKRELALSKSETNIVEEAKKRLMEFKALTAQVKDLKRVRDLWKGRAQNL